MTALPVAPDEAEQDAYPPIHRRFYASLIDGGVVLVGMLVLGTLFENAPDSLVPLRVALFVALFLGYEPVCTAFAATLGQRLMRFRVRRASDASRRIALPAAWLRYAVKIALGLVSFLTMGVSRRRRAIHDLVSGSVALELAALPAATRPPTHRVPDAA